MAQPFPNISKEDVAVMGRKLRVSFPLIPSTSISKGRVKLSAKKGTPQRPRLQGSKIGKIDQQS